MTVGEINALLALLVLVLIMGAAVDAIYRHGVRHRMTAMAVLLVLLGLLNVVSAVGPIVPDSVFPDVATRFLAAALRTAALVVLLGYTLSKLSAWWTARQA